MMSPDQNGQPSQPNQPSASLNPQYPMQNDPGPSAYSAQPPSMAPQFVQQTPMPQGPTPQYQQQPNELQPPFPGPTYQAQPGQPPYGGPQYQNSNGYAQPPQYPQQSRNPIKKILSGKGKLIAIIGGALGIAAVAGLAFFFISLNKVSPSEYETALKTAVDVSSAYSDIQGVYISSSSTETERENGLDTLEKAKAELDSKLAELSTMKAAKKDKDVKAALATLTEKKSEYDIAYGAEVEAYEKIYPIASEFRADTVSLTDNGIAALMGKYRDRVRGVTGLEHNINKTYLKSLGDLFEKLERLAEKVVEGRIDYRKYDSQVTSDFYSSISDVSNADRDWRSNMDKLTSEADIRDSIYDLGDLLLKKANRAG